MFEVLSDRPRLVARANGAIVDPQDPAGPGRRNAARVRGRARFSARVGMEWHGLDARALEWLLYEQSGLLVVSGGSSASSGCHMTRGLHQGRGQR